MKRMIYIVSFLLLTWMTMDASDVRAAESKIPHVKDVRMYGCKQEFSRPNFSIYLQDGSGNSIKKIGDALKDGCEKMLSNPDGQRLYYSSMNATNLYTIQTNGKNLSKITPSVKGYGFELLDAKKNRVFYSYAAQKGGYCER